MGTEPSERSQLPSVLVHVIRGKASTSTREMKGRSLLIGSGQQCDIQMRSPEVAPSHAMLTRGVDGVFVQALDTEHPVFLNGSTVSDAFLSNGDVMRLGPFELSLTIEGGAATGAEAPAWNSLVSSTAPTDSATGLKREPDAEEVARRGLRANLQQSMRKLAELTSAVPVRPSPGPVPATVPAAQIESAGAAMPERLLDIHRDQASKDKELERRKRQVYDDMVKLESERQLLRQDRARFEKHRAEVDRQVEDVARRESELAAKSAEMEQREVDLRSAQQEIESLRILVQEESIRQDRAEEFLSARRSRLLRLRRKLLTQYRSRRERLDALAVELGDRSTKLTQQRESHEAEIVHWKRFADELGHRQAELKRAEAEIVRRLELVDRKESELEERRHAFEREVAEVHERAKSLEAYKSDLDRRKSRIAEEESALRDARRTVEEQFERARQRSTEIHRRHEEIEARALTLEKQERYLKDQAAILDRERLQHADLDRQLAAREAQIQLDQSELVAARQSIDAERSELRVREISLAEEREEIGRREARLKDLAEQNALDQREIDRRYAELESHSRAILQQFEEERQAIEARRAEIDGLHKVEADRLSEIEKKEEDWNSRICQVRELAADLAHREGILHARNRQVDSVERSQSAERVAMQEREDAMHAASAGLESERHAFARQVEETKEKAAWLEQEAERLKSLSEEIESRQKELLERERHWFADVSGRQAQLNDLAAELRGSSSSGATSKGSGLRGLAGRLFKGAPADEHRGASDGEQSGEGEAATQPKIETVLAELGRMDDEHQVSTETQSILESDGKRLAMLRESVATQMQQVRAAESDSADADETPEASKRLEETLRSWADQLTVAQKAMEVRSRELDERQAEPTSVRMPAKRWAEPKLAGGFGQTLVRPVRAKRTVEQSGTDDELANCLLRVGLLDEPRLRFFRLAARNRHVSLAEELIRGKVLTAYQMNAAMKGGDALLHLGPAAVLDVLHIGAVATTYLVGFPKEEAPCAARMLAPQWSRDPAQRRQYEIVLESLREFRHPNVVTTLGSMIAGERFGTITEYVESVSLAQLANFTVPPAVLVNFAYQAVCAVVAAQRAGFVHQNIRPSRLLITPGGDLKVLGYGEPNWLSKIHRCEKGRSHSVYVAPELATPTPVIDARADLYSVAQICQQIALYGQSATSLLDPSFAEDYPESFRKTIAAMLSPSSANRPNPIQVLDALDAIVDPSAVLNWPDMAIVFDAQGEVEVRKAAA